MTNHPLTDKQKLLRLLSELQERASCNHCIDECGDFYNPGEARSHDDAFDDGRWYGEIEFARELLERIGEAMRPTTTQEES